MRLLWTVLTLAALTGVLRAEGIPVKSELVRSKCGACHNVDSQQRMSRISYQRKTPEGWEETVRRMVRLHDVTLTPAEARQIVQYLSAQHGLTASELARISYALEQHEESEQIPNESVKQACATCHSYAKIAAQRRTKEEWLKVKNFLLAMFPTMVYQHRAIDWVATADQALPYLAEQFPLETPEWQRERDMTPPPDGTWVVRGHQAGKGDYVGQATMAAGADGAREMQISLEFPDGSKATRSSTGHWFGAAAWRGSTRSPEGRGKEIFHLSPDGKVLHGRWISVDRPGIWAEESFYRGETGAQVLNVYPKSAKAGSKALEFRIFGAGLPSGLKPGDVSLGDGVRVVQVKESSPNRIAVIADIGSDAKIGARDVRVGPASGPAMLAVYDKTDYIRVVPDRTMARIGGIKFAKQYVQFEAHAFNRGPDGVIGNADDLDLGPVKSAWAVQELPNAYDDQDHRYVGTIDQNGLFTPGVEGPNPERARSAENSGDVWVEASYTPAPGSPPLRARAYLLVSIPKLKDNLIP
jgi:quinohemoprotein amine dehydrogenase